MPVIAFVLVRTVPGTSHELITSRKIKGVKMAHSVFGRYDAVLILTAKDLEELSKTIYEVVEKHPNVVHTETLIAMPYPIPEVKQPVERPHRVVSFHCPNCHNLVEQGSTICPFCGYIFQQE